MSGSFASAQTTQLPPPGIENVGVDERLDAPLPADAVFLNHRGERVRLGDFFDGERPLLLNLVYHQCPSFCSLVLDGVLAALKSQPWTVGQEFRVLSISMDPRDTPAIAADKRQRILHQYGRAAGGAWSFLVPATQLSERELIASYGRDAQVDRVARALGFRYQWMPREKQYAHPGVTFLIKPDGRVARYLYGMQPAANDVRIGLLEASQGRHISAAERIILYCYRYDGSAQGYVLMAMRVMQLGGVLTALVLFGALGLLWRNELVRRRRGKLDEAASPVDGGAAVRS